MAYRGPMRSATLALAFLAACSNPVIDAETVKSEAVLHGTPHQICAASRKLAQAYEAAQRYLEAEVETGIADELCQMARNASS